ncbi:hypothetical protein [Brevundimonas sp.]|uniref:hypothetical protein n=1 Tax=Brevundimonas sp. TaxID=1871086 RepID=UPI002EDBA470
MWNLIRTVLVALALAGFFGQSTAHAMPIQMFQNVGIGAEAMDCAEAMDMDGDRSENPGDCCKDMTPDCMAKMGCAAVAAPMPPLVLIPPPASRGTIAFLHLNVSREGAGPAPLHSPPQQQA